MAKIKTLFVCTNCGYNSSKWEGKCYSCNEWNTLLETHEIKSSKTTLEQKQQVWKEDTKKNVPKLLNDIHKINQNRISTNDEEFDRVLGGGIVTGSVTLLGGRPGIGKSTLLLQLAINANLKVLYVSGEESAEQIKMRADRVGFKNENCFILSEINLNNILKEAKAINPQVLIIDSVQTIYSPYIESSAGSITQVRECASELQRFAKETNIPLFMIGHINKDGNIAGPKVLEHIVDTVLLFEGDRNYSYRLLRVEKNRFGSTDELGIYEMHGSGLKCVTNPSEMLLSQSSDLLSGSVIGTLVEGMRPMLIETQALVSPAVYGNSQRSATGFELRRLNMILAVLEKRLGLAFAQQDVFLNIAGGIKISDPGLDLSITTALISSLNNIAVSNKTVFAGEIGLTGEIRAVNRIDQRILEAERLGFESIYISSFNKISLDKDKLGIRVYELSRVDELLQVVFS